MEPQSPIFEEYIRSRYLHILTGDRLHIPGLHLFGRQIRTTATESLPAHDHGSCFEIVYICSGTPSFTVGGTGYRLSGGDVFITRPHETHSTSSIPVSISEMYWMQVDFSELEEVLFLDRTATRDLARRLTALPVHTVSMDLQKTTPLIGAAFSAAQQENPQLAARYITLFLSLVLENAQKTDFRLTPDIGKAAAYILDHITRPLTLEELAAVSYLSVSQFKQKFKQQMGVSPRQFINARRIETAKSLLREGLSTAQVAAILQFASPSYFITVFKRYTSRTPGQYRESSDE